ncbi:transcription factor BIM2-like [Bidens hawaiensis]|uniref:transcription factor BIM2-like n=1 Tax=Bidens hawaiensis TaxID=980011 RepID=UPI00404A7BC3
MKSSKTHQDEDYDEFNAAKTDTNPNSKDVKNSDKVDATRSKHSVTEQRRRSKINERFQILRDLIPNSDQKRDTASFLLEVIEYVQYLKERVQKYEGSYPGWGAEPTKLMPWRNSHWRVPSFGHPPVIKPDSGLTPSFPVRFDENVTMAPGINTGPQNPARSDPSGDLNCNLMDSQPAVQPSIPVPVQQADGTFSHSALHCNVNIQSSDLPVAGDPSQQEEVTVEGGTISISSVYSQGLLNSLTQALQSSGVDLTQATISVQVDLGKRANRGQTSGTSTAKDHENPHPSNQEVGRFQEFNNGENSDQASKRLKT